MRLPKLPALSDFLPSASPPHGWRGMDFHSHLLPGVDDGISGMEDALAAIRGLRALGFAGAVLTPHIYKDVFDNGSAGLRAAFDEFRAALAAAAIEFSLYLAAEYFADEHFLRLIEQDDLLAVDVAGERWVLVEFSYMQESPLSLVCLAALRAAGYRPVIAHVERYRFVAQAPADWLARFAAMGALLQGDVGSLVGQFGEPVKKFASWALERGEIAIWGTDLHHPAQLERYVAPALARLPGGRLNGLLAGLEGTA